MGKTTLNTALGSLSGMIDDWCYVQRNGVMLVRKRPDFSGVVPTAAQLAVQAQFTVAADYAKMAMADPAIAAIYRDAARGTLSNGFAVALTDYMKPPQVRVIDTSAYHGLVGDIIAILAVDDVEVMSVSVVLRGAGGVVLEEGAGVRILSDRWHYTATTQLPLGEEVSIEVTAKDRPGHDGQQIAAFTRVA